MYVPGTAVVHMYSNIMHAATRSRSISTFRSYRGRNLFLRLEWMVLVGRLCVLCLYFVVVADTSSFFWNVTRRKTIRRWRFFVCVCVCVLCVKTPFTTHCCCCVCVCVCWFVSCVCAKSNKQQSQRQTSDVTLFEQTRLLPFTTGIYYSVWCVFCVVCVVVQYLLVGP